jgi:ATP-dependent protease ClpP protease subunit
MGKNLLSGGEMLLYGDVGDPWGWGDGFTPSDVAMGLAEHGAGDITVRLNSGGGSAFDGMAIHSLLKTHAGKVTIAIDGVAASAASLIAMGGDRIEIRKGAMMMIHDPSMITMGTEDDHRASAELLGKLAGSYASVYADRSKKTPDAAREIMRAETWLDSADAVKEGFADGELPEKAATAALFDYRVYAHAPAGLPVRPREGAARGARLEVHARSSAADAALNQEKVLMDKKWAAAIYAAAETSGLPLKTINAIVAKAATEEEAKAALATAIAEAKAAADLAERERQASAGKPWAAGFFASASTSGLELVALNAIVAAAATHDQAKDKLIEAMTAKNNDKPGGDGARVRVGTDARDKLVAGASRSLIARAPLFVLKDGKPSPDGEQNEFSGMTLRELARATLERAGIRDIPRDPMKMVALAMAPVTMTSGLLGTSDFVNILANVANKAMLKGYEESPETFAQWTGTGTLPDFKTAKRVDLGLFPSLAKIEEGAEYTYASISDRGVSLVLATYGKMFSITRQAIINDDLSAFTKIPMKMGNAAKRTIADLVWAILVANPNAPDGTALFHANHNNLITAAGILGATALDTARVKMATQKDPDNIKSGLNIRPAYLLVPVALQGTANQLMASQSEPGQNNAAVANRVANMAQVIGEARLDADSAVKWYLAGDPNVYDTIEVDYLNGVQAPTLEQREGWNVDGAEFKVRHDAGVNLLDFRALLRSNGVA